MWTSGCTAASSSSSSSSLWSSANEMGRVVDTVLIVRGKAAGMVPFLEILYNPIVVWMVHDALSESLFQC